MLVEKLNVFFSSISQFQRSCLSTCSSPTGHLSIRQIRISSSYIYHHWYLQINISVILDCTIYTQIRVNYIAFYINMNQVSWYEMVYFTSSQMVELNVVRCIFNFFRWMPSIYQSLYHQYIINIIIFNQLQSYYDDIFIYYPSKPSMNQCVI